MGLDIAALQEKLNKFNRGAGGTQVEGLWRPSEGKQTIRLLPWKENPENCFIELKFHYKIGGKTLLSPTSYDKRDPIAEFGNSLLGSRTPEEYNQAKPFLPKLRTHVPIIVRGEEEKGVRFYSFGKTVYKQLIEFITDEDIGDITHPIHGRDLILTYIPDNKSDTGFAKTTIMYKPVSTPLSPDKKMIEKFLTEQPDIRAIFPEPSYAELKSILAAHLDPDSVGSEPDSNTSESESVTVATKTPAAASKSLNSVMEEFDELFG